jgi:phospholipid-binding lipoprotein MlaA
VIRPLAGALALLSLLEFSSGCATAGPDPLEPVNRRVFWFNEQVDTRLLEPLARGWDFAVPELAQSGIENFFENLRMPVVFANDLLQLKPRAAADDLVRLVTNTSFGIGGLIDVASREGVPKHDEDFGQTLGFWGLPGGPYLVLPLLGPSTPRDALGMLADGAATPHVYFVDFWVSAAGTGVEILNLRARYLEEVEQNRSEAFDYYVFIRSAYLQNRRKKVEDAEELAEDTEEDLYFFEEDEYGEEYGEEDEEEDEEEDQGGRELEEEGH